MKSRGELECVRVPLSSNMTSLQLTSGCCLRIIVIIIINWKLRMVQVSKKISIIDYCLAFLAFDNVLVHVVTTSSQQETTTQNMKIVYCFVLFFRMWRLFKRMVKFGIISFHVSQFSLTSDPWLGKWWIANRLHVCMRNE